MNANEKPSVVPSLLHRTYLVCFSLLAIVLMIAGSQLAAIAKTVVTDQGPIKNGTNPNNAGFYPMNATEYLGIPYAAPPVGNLRWRPPQPPAPFKGLFQADGSLTRSCPQPGGLGGTFADENCLFLNVYVPNIPQPAHGFPVMVWIHGGGLVEVPDGSMIRSH
jgi:para-nitrobenzyl esterase